MKGTALLPLVLVALLGGGQAVAQTLRCGGDLVSVGDLKFEVVSKCGEPASKESHQKEREVDVFDKRTKTIRRLRTTVTVDQWVYNFGPGGFLYVVTFEDGRVVDIESAGFGR